jgi:type 1 fimbria pilin
VIRGLGNPDFYTSLSNNTWHEVTLCWDGTTFKSYVNGSFVSNLNQGTASSQNVQVKIGNSGGNNEPFAGQISNVKVYTKGLSAAEVLQNYNALKGRYGI